MKWCQSQNVLKNACFGWLLTCGIKILLFERVARLLFSTANMHSAFEWTMVKLCFAWKSRCRCIFEEFLITVWYASLCILCHVNFTLNKNNGQSSEVKSSQPRMRWDDDVDVDVEEGLGPSIRALLWRLYSQWTLGGSSVWLYCQVKCCVEKAKGRGTAQPCRWPLQFNNKSLSGHDDDAVIYTVGQNRTGQPLKEPLDWNW